MLLSILSHVASFSVLTIELFMCPILLADLVCIASGYWLLAVRCWTAFPIFVYMFVSHFVCALIESFRAVPRLAGSGYCHMRFVHFIGDYIHSIAAAGRAPGQTSINSFRLVHDEECSTAVGDLGQRLPGLIVIVCGNLISAFCSSPLCPCLSVCLLFLFPFLFV